MQLTTLTVTAADTVVFDTPCGHDDDGQRQSVSQLAFAVTGTFTGTFIAELSLGGVWTAVGISSRLTNAIAATVTTPGSYRFDTEGATRARVKCTALSAGTPSVAGNTVTSR